MNGSRYERIQLKYSRSSGKTQKTHSRRPVVVISNDSQGGNKLARSNYQFKKRQKELARKKKQEEKRQRKLAKNTDISEETSDQSQEQSPDQPQEQSPDAKND